MYDDQDSLWRVPTLQPTYEESRLLPMHRFSRAVALGILCIAAGVNIVWLGTASAGQDEEVRLGAPDFKPSSGLSRRAGAATATGVMRQPTRR